MLGTLGSVVGREAVDELELGRGNLVEHPIVSLHEPDLDSPVAQQLLVVATGRSYLSLPFPLHFVHDIVLLSLGNFTQRWGRRSVDEESDGRSRIIDVGG